MLQSTSLRTLRRPHPEWGSFLFMVDGILNPVPVSGLDQVVLKELIAEGRGLTLVKLKKRSDYSWITTMSGECLDEQGTSAVSTPLADAEVRLSDIASAIPAVDPKVLTLKHSAFLAQLLIDEANLGESTHGGYHDHARFSMQATDGPTGQIRGAKPSPINMPVSWYIVQDLQRVLCAKAEGIEQWTRLDLLKMTWKTPIWSEEDDEEKTLPDLEVPLVYSLHYSLGRLKLHGIKRQKVPKIHSLKKHQKNYSLACKKSSSFWNTIRTLM